MWLWGKKVNHLRSTSSVQPLGGNLRPWPVMTPLSVNKWYIFQNFPSKDFFWLIFRYGILCWGSCYTLSDIYNIMHWISLSRIHSLFCVERPLFGLHRNLHSKWCLDVPQLSDILLLILQIKEAILSVFFLTFSTSSSVTSKESKRRWREPHPFRYLR